jgi:sporulation protein YlmC with PRC-barrel domain
MATNQFENSRVSEGTLRTGAQHDGNALNESSAVSRDDVRDGFAEPEISSMIAEGGPAPGEGNLPIPEGPGTSRLFAASTLLGERVRNLAGEELGNIEELMVDLTSGRIAYAVLSFGGFLGFGSKRFPVPWNALRSDRGAHEIVLDTDRETLERAPHFDREKWPDMANPAFEKEVHGHYASESRWEHTVTDAGDFTGGEHTKDRSREYETTTSYRTRPAR